MSDNSLCTKSKRKKDSKADADNTQTEDRSAIFEVGELHSVHHKFIRQFWNFNISFVQNNPYQTLSNPHPPQTKTETAVVPNIVPIWTRSGQRSLITNGLPVLQLPNNCQDIWQASQGVENIRMSEVFMSVITGFPEYFIKAKLENGIIYSL